MVQGHPCPFQSTCRFTSDMKCLSKKAILNKTFHLDGEWLPDIELETGQLRRESDGQEPQITLLAPRYIKEVHWISSSVIERCGVQSMLIRRLWPPYSYSESISPSQRPLWLSIPVIPLWRRQEMRNLVPTPNLQCTTETDTIRIRDPQDCRPSGVPPEVTVESMLVQWCHWRQTAATERLMVESSSKENMSSRSSGMSRGERVDGRPCLRVEVSFGGGGFFEKRMCYVYANCIAL